MAAAEDELENILAEGGFAVQPPIPFPLCLHALKVSVRSVLGLLKP